MPNKELIPPSKNKRLTKREQNAIVLCIVKDIIALESIHEITHKWVEKTGKSEDSVRRYIRLARELIADRPQESTRELINKHIAIREDIYRNAEHSRDKLQAVESIAKLQGLDVKRIEVVNKTLNDIEDTVILEALTEADGE